MENNIQKKGDEIVGHMADLNGALINLKNALADLEVSQKDVLANLRDISNRGYEALGGLVDELNNNGKS